MFNILMEYVVFEIIYKLHPRFAACRNDKIN